MAVLYFLVLISAFVLANASDEMSARIMRYRPGPSGRNTDYCSVKTCEPKSHTMCKYNPLPWVSPRCGQVKSSSITPAEIKEVLDKHNELRRKIASGRETRGRNGPQPAARNLGDLVWNDELARIAQTWANQCTDGHDECKNTHDSTVNQNIGHRGWSEGYNTKLADIVEDWYNEVETFDNRDVKSYQHRVPFTQHYSQLVWAATKEVGCGVIRYYHPVHSKGNYRTRLVCNYAPMGNMRNEPIYETR